MLASGAYQAMSAAKQNYYESLIWYSETKSLSYPSQNLHQIKLDLPRTFADEPYFDKNTAIGQEVIKSIERVCLAYSVRNGVIGYCQGFNFIAGRLL